MSTAFLVLFIVVSAIHLYGRYTSKPKIRVYTKPLLVLSLLGWYCCYAPDPMTIMVFALFFSWLGDVFLLPHGTKWFICGGVSFCISHFLLIKIYSANISFDSLNPLVIGFAAAFFTGASLLVFRGLRKNLKKLLFYPMLAYLLLNGAMNCCALYQMVCLPCTGTVLVFIGALLFFISDSLLFHANFKRSAGKHNHFMVMLTYLLAEFLIVYGTALI